MKFVVHLNRLWFFPWLFIWSILHSFHFIMISLFWQIWSVFRSLFSKYLSHLWRDEVIFYYSLLLFIILMNNVSFDLVIDASECMTTIVSIFPENENRIWMPTLSKWCNIPITTINRPPVWRVWKNWIHSSIMSAWILTGDHRPLWLDFSILTLEIDKTFFSVQTAAIIEWIVQPERVLFVQDHHHTNRRTST